MTKKLNIVMMSGTETGCSYIESLKSLEFIDIALVVTGTDKPRGRGRKVERALVAGYCDMDSLSVFQTENINSKESVDILRQVCADLAVIVDFGQILSRDVLDIFPSGSFNIHYSILPDLRGPDPIRWALLKGYHETGVTLMKIDEKIDTGSIVSIRKVKIEGTDNYSTLKEKLTGEGIRLLNSLVSDIYDGKEIKIKPQEDTQGITYARKLKKELCGIDWNQPAGEIAGRIRAFSPAPGCTTVYKKKNMKLKLISVAGSELTGDVPGKIIEVTKEDFTVASSKRSIKILELQPSGKRVMSTGEFLAGNPVEIGDIFE